MTPDKLPDLDPVIHSQVRLAILSILLSVRSADFNSLKNLTGATDGNLSTHLTKLEEAEYVSIKKMFKDKKPLTSCSLTEKGRRAFAAYLRALEEYLPSSKEPAGKKGGEAER